ncbi:MAG: 50S ribosomal protein L21 [Alphaproteobacteria bacterium]|nr:50S ribosomal protein L21 [Alphaproteobacteria bacterium]
MFAIFKSGAKQYSVKVGDTLAIEKIDAKDMVEFTEVLAVADKIGAPYVAGAKVKAKVVAQNRGEKIIVFKKKRRHNYRRKAGHRQAQTIVKITDIA